MGAVKNWRVELTAGGKTLAEVKIQRDIFLGNDLLPLLFVIAMIPVKQLLRKCTGRYTFTKWQKRLIL